MAEFKLDRFRYTWRGEWQESTVYKKDDIVYNGGKSYVRITAHTSPANFANESARILPSLIPIDSIGLLWLVVKHIAEFIHPDKIMLPEN